MKVEGGGGGGGGGSGGDKAEIFFFLTYFETICKFIYFTTRPIKFSLPTQRKENCFTRNLEVDEA